MNRIQPGNLINQEEMGSKWYSNRLELHVQVLVTWEQSEVLLWEKIGKGSMMSGRGICDVWLCACVWEYSTTVRDVLWMKVKH